MVLLLGHAHEVAIIYSKFSQKLLVTFNFQLILKK